MQFFTRALELIYPPCCLSCHVRLPEAHPLELCAACERRLHAVPPPRCPRCGRHSALSLQRDDVCAACRRAPPRFHAAFAAYAYADVLRDCVHAVKFDSHARLGAALGHRLARLAATHLPPQQYDVVVPVPLHPAQRRDRGFNQAELLARPVSDAFQIACASRALRRTRRTQTQSRLEPEAREANVAGAFAVREPRAIEGRRVLLVDDVLTTGATANACSAALLAAGAANVDVLVLATN